LEHRQEHRHIGRQDGQGPIFIPKVKSVGFTVFGGRQLSKSLRILASVPLILFAFALGLVVPAAAQEIQFASQGPLQSDTGHLLVEWEAPGEVTLMLSKGVDTGDRRALYQGGNSAYFMSGLTDGEYTLTLVGEEGQESEPMKLTVEHQSIDQAIWLTIIGAIITLATILVIVRGERS